MPLVLLPSCTRFDVLNVLEHVCAFFKTITVPFAQTWPPMHCAFAAPSVQCAHAPAMVATRHMFSVRLAYTSHFHCKEESFNHRCLLLFSSNSSWTFSLVFTLLSRYLLSMMDPRPLWAMTHLPLNRSYLSHQLPVATLEMIFVV